MLLAHRAKAEDGRSAAAAQRAAAERATCEVEMELEERVEEISAGARAYEQAAEALKIVPFGAKRSNNVRRGQGRSAPLSQPRSEPLFRALLSSRLSAPRSCVLTGRTRPALLGRFNDSSADALRAVRQHPRAQG